MKFCFKLFLGDVYKEADILARGISDNQYHFSNAFIWENKSYNSFRLTVYVSALFCKKQGYGTNQLLKKLPWRISTFCFVFKCKHNANANYDTNTNKKPGPCILTPGRVFYKSNLYFIQNSNRMKNETRRRMF